jgi:cytochrome b involved in lipid metabolism
MQLTKCTVWLLFVLLVLTFFLPCTAEHPAGPQSIHELAGKNGTEAFAAVHNENLLEDFAEDIIGKLVAP